MPVTLEAEHSFKCETGRYHLESVQREQHHNFALLISCIVNIYSLINLLSK